MKSIKQIAEEWADEKYDVKNTPNFHGDTAWGGISRFASYLSENYELVEKKICDGCEKTDFKDLEIINHTCKPLDSVQACTHEWRLIGDGGIYTARECKKCEKVEALPEKECEHGWWDLKVGGLSQCSKCKTIKSTYEIAIMAGALPSKECSHVQLWSTNTNGYLCQKCGKLVGEIEKPLPPHPPVELPEEIKIVSWVGDADILRLVYSVNQIIKYLKPK